MDAINIFSAENPEGRVDVARAVGSMATALFIYDLAPGQSQSPYHYEYQEEMALVVDGTVVVRTSDGEHLLERGDPRASRPVRRSAQVAESERLNREDLDVLELSGAGRLRLSRQQQDRRVASATRSTSLFRRDTAVPWSDGEEGWE